MKPRLAFLHRRSRHGNSGSCLHSGRFWTGLRLLAADDNVVSPSVEDRVAAFGARDQVVGRRWIEVNLRKADGRVGCETAEVVSDDRAECAAYETDGVFANSRDSVIQDHGVFGVVGIDAIREVVLEFDAVVPDYRVDLRISRKVL